MPGDRYARWYRRRKVSFYLKWLITYVARKTMALMVSIPLRHNPRYDDLWLIAERDDEASDSGYQLYCHIVSNHPEINVRYVLNRKCRDYATVPKPENIIEPGSREHYLCHILCTKSISTHLYGASNGRYFVRVMLPFMRRKSIVCLQHGVTKDSVPHAGLFKGHIVISSESEKAFYRASGYTRADGFLPVGLARFDALNDQSTGRPVRTIMVMPTFRGWLERLPMDDFARSEFFSQWQNFLHSSTINEALERNNLRMVFMLHWKFKRYTHLFESGFERIQVVQPSVGSLRDLKSTCSALITDYSSVFMDFAYMNKPVLFHQFDSLRFFTDHHAGGFHQYPFGAYAATHDAVAAYIDRWAQTNFSVDAARAASIRQFFYFHDADNTARNFDAIRALQP